MFKVAKEKEKSKIQSNTTSQHKLYTRVNIAEIFYIISLHNHTVGLLYESSIYLRSISFLCE